MPAGVDPDVFVLGAIMVALFLGVVGIGIAFWMERDEETSNMEAAASASLKAQRATGGIIGVIGSVVIGIVGSAWQLGMGVMDVLVIISDFVAQSPKIVFGLLSAVVGAGALKGILPLGPWQYLGIALVIIGIGGIIAGRKRKQRARAA